jgi:hypothetical protein
MKSSLFCNVTQRGLVVIYRRFETTYRPHMGPIGCPETSVNNHQSTLRNIQEERISYLYRDEILKSRICDDTY